MINHPNMFGKAKKTVSATYKDELLAKIAHYEKRIEEALNKRKQNSFEDESFSMEEYVTNPYKLNFQPSQYELKQQEASLSDRASMTLELANLTVMQSEINVMVTPPEIRKPVPEDGVWYEVAADCKIDLVSFGITFYAHKPHRKFAPTRYRNIAVVLVKPAHEKELSHSILPKLHLPNLILQVLQNYATAFRSRRTTLLELAEKYGEKLRMEAMPEGGYRVKFLDLLQVDWMLENLWSPIVPFCHRMKFEVEYMSKDYIQAIGKLYKQFKDPSLDTSERTLILSKIFDICLQAAGPTRELQESFESDPETAGSLHERRTTIDQEPDVPSVEHSPKKKDPSGKENRPQNRKTSMAPPKTIPKKAKKRLNEKDVSENRKNVKRAIESESGNVVKKSRVDNNDISKSKAGLKGGSHGQDKDKIGAVGSKTNIRDNEKDAVNANVDTEIVGTENQIKTNKVNAKNTKGTDATGPTISDDNVKNRNGKTVKSKGSGDKGDGDINNAINTKVIDAGTAISDDNMKKRDGKTINSKESGNKEVGDINNAKKIKDVVGTKGSKKDHVKTNDKIVKPKDKTVNNASSKNDTNLPNTKNAKITDKHTIKALDEDKESNVARSKGADNIADTQNKLGGKNTKKSKNTEQEKVVSSKKAETVNKNSKKVASEKKDEGSVASSKHGTKVNGVDTVNSEEKNAVNNVAVLKNKEDAKNNGTKNKLTNTKKVNDGDTVSRTNSKTVALKNDDGKNKAASKNAKDKNNADGGSKKVPKEPNVHSAVGNIDASTDKTKADVAKKTISKDSTVKPKEVNNVTNNKNGNKLTDKEKTVKASDKIVEKRKLVKETAGDDTNKVKAQLAKKTKVVNPKNTEKSDLDNNKITVNETKTKLVGATTDEHEIQAKKRKTDLDNKNTKNDNPKTTKNNIESKSTKLNGTRILKENTNERKNTMATKTQKNMLNVTITKSKIIPISKLQTDNKLKSKIPMMKGKMTFSSLGDKLKMNNLGKISTGVEKKIPQKSLPVFKKVAKNSTRMSPRKLPTIKPSSHGFSIK